MASISQQSGDLQQQLEAFEQEHNPDDPEQIKVMYTTAVAACDAASEPEHGKPKGLVDSAAPGAHARGDQTIAAK